MHGFSRNISQGFQKFDCVRLFTNLWPLEAEDFLRSELLLLELYKLRQKRLRNGRWNQLYEFIDSHPQVKKYYFEFEFWIKLSKQCPWVKEIEGKKICVQEFFSLYNWKKLTALKHKKLDLVKFNANCLLIDFNFNERFLDT